jgi:predicted Zn-dependent protease
MKLCKAFLCKRIRIRVFAFFAVLLILSLAAMAASKPVDTKSEDPLLDILQQELTRAKSGLAKASPAPYFISYSALDHKALVVIGSEGALYTSTQVHRRQADVSVRVGSYTLDNTHGKSRYSGLSSDFLPLENDRAAIQHALWRLTDREYKKASEAFLKVQADQEVRTKEEDDSADFSSEAPATEIEGDGTPPSFDQPAMEQNVRQISAEFRKYPQVTSSSVVVEADDMLRYYVSTDGARTRRPENMIRMVLEAETQAPDGMRLMRVENFLAPTADKLPSHEVLAAKIAKMADDLAQLQKAKLAEPYSGPAMLSGRAAAVFFHEVLGHRLEGQRQRGDEEGQTFTKKINQPVLPNFLSVVDDPTLHELNGEDLAGWYNVDDEGEPAQRVTLIQDGILKNFLMSRMPVRGFVNSNGHGRAQPGYLPIGRQGNLIVESSRQLDERELRQKFIDEIKKQGKSYGLYFEDIEGGFTLTTRELPQAFQVLPVMVWRVYADGRPDELVRGVDIVGTPLAALGHIAATGNKEYVFNGICGAESGNIPVSAAAPAMLFSEIEVQRKQQSHELPPLLPAPPLQEGSKPQ